MNKIDVVNMIGAVIADVDGARGTLAPSDPNRRQLDDLRAMLNDRQWQLSQAVVDDTTEQFMSAADLLQRLYTGVRMQIIRLIQGPGSVTDAINSIHSDR